MLLLKLDREDPTPVYLQIRDRISDLVDEGTLRPGDRLPPTREFADTLGVHRSTVVRAYNELQALGLLESRSGGYSTIRLRSRPPTTRMPDGASGASLMSWSRMTSPGLRALRRKPDHAADVADDDDRIDFERLAADPRLAPDDELRRCVKNVLGRDGGRALDYTDPRGWPPLRETIRLRMRAHGVAASDEEILVTGGAQHALDLVLRGLTRPGDAVAIEAPTYALAHPLLRLHGLKALEVPIREGGLDLDRLETILRTKRPRLLYTMPNFQNPTGLTTDQPHRERLLALCERHRTPIIEDGFEEEMKYFGQAVLPIKSMDTRGGVIYVGTFSKVVFPGLRLGWIVAPAELIAALTDLHHIASLGGNTLSQAAAAKFCRGGGFETYLRRIHRVYRRRMQTLLRGLSEHLPERVRWTRPTGGYTLWMTVPGKAADEAELMERFDRAGVRVAAGRRFRLRAPSSPSFRLSIACVDESVIDEGCRRLGVALRG